MSDLKFGEEFNINPNSVVEEEHDAKEFLRKVNTLRQTSAHSCDTTIEVDDESFPAHKIVLAALSPYLERVVFGHDTSTPLPINLTGTMTAETFQLILDYAYTCKIALTSANVEPLLRASCKLEVSPLKNTCEEYLGRSIDQENFVKMYELASELACEVLYDFFNKFIRKKFMEIWEGNTFLELESDILIDIIKSDDLEVRSEETVYNALMRWTNHKEERKPFLTEGLLFYEGSSHTVTGPLYFLSIQDGKVRPLKSAPFDDWSWIKSVTVAGGTIYAHASTEQRCQALLRYDMLSNKWEHMFTFESDQYFKGADIIDEYNGCLYITELKTSCRTQTLKILKEFDVLNKTTNVLSHFSEYGKPYFRFDDNIYITVKDKTDYRTRFRRYSPFTSKWTDLAEFQGVWTTLLCCPFQGKLFTLDGTPNVNATIMNAQVYDISRNRWEWGAPLKKVHRRPAALVVLDGCLTFIDIARFPLLEIERYSPKKNAWEACENQFVAEATFDPRRMQFVPGVVKSKPF